MDEAPTRGSRSGGLERWLAGTVVVYFVVRVLFFAIRIAPGVPPDEQTHMGIIELYSQSLLFVEDTPETYHLGLVTRAPFLYHFVMGRLLALNVLGVDATLYLRVANALLALASVLLAYGLATRLSASSGFRLLFLVMITNTLMFSFLAASVSYDNLVNLLAVASLWALVAFLESEDPLHLLLLLVLALLGCLTKLSFLPLAAALASVLVVERRTKLIADLRRLLGTLPPRQPSRVGIWILALAALAGNLWIYGGNLMSFGSLQASCQQVLSLDACLENRIFARNWIVGQYRSDAMSLDEAIAATTMIQHLGDRDHAIRLLQFERAKSQSAREPLPRWDYMHQVWDQAMKPTIFGVQAHRSMIRSPRSLLPYNLILMAAFLLWVRGVSWVGGERIWLYLGLLVLLYFVALVGYYNYRLYLATDAPFQGVQGRYLFPVLVPAYLVAARYLLRPFSKRLRAVVLAAVCAVYLVGDLPYFLRHADADWFAVAEHDGASGGEVGASLAPTRETAAPAESP